MVSKNERKKAQDLMYIFMSEDGEWHIAKDYEPLSLIPLERMLPTVKRDLRKIDVRNMLDPAQEYVNDFKWDIRNIKGDYEEDVRIMA